MKVTIVHLLPQQETEKNLMRAIEWLLATSQEKPEGDTASTDQETTVESGNEKSLSLR